MGPKRAPGVPDRAVDVRLTTSAHKTICVKKPNDRCRINREECAFALMKSQIYSGLRSFNGREPIIFSIAIFAAPVIML